MINVTIYQQISVPFFAIKHGQFAAVARTRSGANKLLRKVWESFITKRDRIVLREHKKTVNAQKKFDSQLQTAQQSAGQQIDRRIDKTLAGLDAKVKNIIKETVKSQSIKKEAMYCDPSLLECDLFSEAIKSPHPIDLRSPTYKRQDTRNDRRPQSSQSQGPYFCKEYRRPSGPRQEKFYDPRETPFVVNQPPQPAARRQSSTPPSARRNQNADNRP